MRVQLNAIAALTGVALVFGPLEARAGDAPTQLGLVVMLRALAYDKNFSSHGQGDFVVLVPQSHDDEQFARETEAVNGTRLAGRTVRLKLISEDADHELEGRVGAVVLGKALSGPARSRWSKGAASRKIYTLGLDPELATQHTFLAVTTAEGHVQLIFNQKLAAELGVDFPASLLKMVRRVE